MTATATPIYAPRMFDFMTRVEAARTALWAADAAFQAALVAQFGERKAGDARYASSQHNAETAAARRAFHAASEEFHTVVRSGCTL